MGRRYEGTMEGPPQDSFLFTDHRSSSHRAHRADRQFVRPRHPFGFVAAAVLLFTAGIVTGTTPAQDDYRHIVDGWVEKETTKVNGAPPSTGATVTRPAS